MANDPSPPPRSGGGLSLYANLLQPTDNPDATITAAPVLRRQEPAEEDASKKQPPSLAGSLRFQPTKRPQQNASALAAKAKAKAIANKLTAAPPPESVVTKQEPSKTTIADWTATASDDEWNTFTSAPRQRGGRKKRKKNKDVVEVVMDWDDIYDPTRPNSYEEYKHSEEKIREVREWKDVLYRHRRGRSTRSESEESERIENSTHCCSRDRPRLTLIGRFAPPMSFAPPSNINDDLPPPPADLSSPRIQMTEAPPPPPADVPDDPTGEDAYARRMRLSQQPPPPPPTVEGQITRAPIRYNLPSAPANMPDEPDLLDQPTTTSDEPKSNLPGQSGFAARLMSKYGWSSGQGLGANSDGIINPLYAKADKRKKKSDAEGGGYATPATLGKILGGTKSKGEEEGKFGAMSEVIRLENMLDGMDLDVELTRGDGIMQEIGEECSEKYGSVQRVYIHRPRREESGTESPVVLVQFVSALSALRAVNALEGRVFGGNAITARFWEREKFERGVYE